MVEPVSDGRRNDAGRTICRRRHNLAARRVLFVHRHRVD